MNILNLDPSFKPIQGEEIEYKQFTFAGGEPHLKITSERIDEHILITHRVRSFSDIGFLLLAVDALKRMGAVKINLLLPYFPAARQDRQMVSGEPLTVKIYADLLNQLGLNKIHVLDPHSEVTPALLNNCHVIPNFQFIKTVIEQLPSSVLLVSPDGGALKKIYKVSEYLGGIDVIECSKNRDVKTGKLSGFKVYADDLQGKDCLIVDDICDGGGTFIGLAEELKRKNAGKLYLAVSHGIFSKGIADLTTVYDGIFTTNSFNDFNEQAITQINLDHNYLL